MVHDHLSLHWGKVADMALYDEQLVSSSTLYVCIELVHPYACTIIYYFCLVDWSFFCPSHCQYVVCQHKGEINMQS